ncbi:MAG TPA: hypothetical protein VF313_05455 [Anaerolineaceae bacterium]|jgi:hypothetical protein
MPIYLLDDTLKVEIFVEPADKEFDDNICLSIEESCPLDEKLFCADEVNMYLTARQARQLGLALIEAAEKSSDMSEV